MFLKNKCKILPLMEPSKSVKIGNLPEQKKKKSKYHSVLKELSKPFNEYCSQSTLHGLKYIRDTKLPAIDRMFWLGMFILSVIMSSFVMVKVWQKWTENYFVIIHDADITPVWQVPFPSVAICNYYMIKKSYIDLKTSNDRLRNEYAKLVCAQPEINVDGITTLDYFENEDVYNGDDFYNFLSNATPSCSEMFKSCYFKRIKIDCCTIFRPILTHLGYCYIFNSLPNNIMYKNIDNFPKSARDLYDTLYWDLDHGYPKFHLEINNGTKILPYWLETPGEYLGLVVELIQNISEQQEACSGGYTGFQALINSPANSPILTPSVIKIPTNTELSIELQPITINTNKDLLSISPGPRGCFYSHERSLQFFKYYTSSNCIEECYGEIAYYKCGCIPYFIPGNSSFRMCFGVDSSCISTIWEDVMRAVPIGTSERFKCECLPACSDLFYETSHYYSPMLDPKSTNHFFNEEDYIQENVSISILHMYYKVQQFNGLHRQIDTPLYDFVGTCSGLLGLFLGFSLISGFELVYFFAIRPLVILCIRKPITTKTKIYPFHVNMFELIRDSTDLI